MIRLRNRYRASAVLLVLALLVALLPLSAFADGEEGLDDMGVAGEDLEGEDGPSEDGASADGEGVTSEEDVNVDAEEGDSATPDPESDEEGAAATTQERESTQLEEDDGDEGVEGPSFETMDTNAATYTEDWDGRGTDSERCGIAGGSLRPPEGWIHWVFATKGASTDATLTLGGTGSGTYSPGPPLNANVWHFYTPYFEVDGLTATIELTGGSPGGGGGLVISDFCPGNGETPGDGSLVVDKLAVAGADFDEGDLPGDFGFRVTCDNDLDETFTLSSGEQELFEELPAGTLCDVTEADAKGAASTTISIDGGTAFEATSTGVLIAGNSTRQVTFTNTFIDENGNDEENGNGEVVLGTGGLAVAKMVEGDEGVAPAAFGFGIVCTTVEDADFALGDDASFSLGDGESNEVGVEIPEGTSCVVTETDDGDADSTTGVVEVDGSQTGTFGGTTTVTIAEDTETLVTFTNVFTVTPDDDDDEEMLGSGTLFVEKIVAGEAGPGEDDDVVFEIDVTCDGFDVGEESPVGIGASGATAEIGVAIPEDTVCTVTETEDGGADATSVAVNPAGDAAGSTGDSAEVTIVEGETLVRFTNTFDAEDVTEVEDEVVERETVVEDEVVERETVVRDETVVEDSTLTTPTRVDAGGGGTAAGGMPLQGMLAALLALAGAALGLTEWRARRQFVTS